jgi:hypothetical protein
MALLKNESRFDHRTFSLQLTFLDCQLKCMAPNFREVVTLMTITLINNKLWKWMHLTQAINTMALK